MRAKWLAVLLVGGLVAGGAWWQAAVNADPQAAWSEEPTTQAKGDVEMEQDCFLSDYRFARRIAGTYLAEFEFYGGSLYAIAQCHADGTCWHTDQSDFGLAGLTELNSPLMGSWKRTGPRQATTVRLCLFFDNPHVTLPTIILRSQDVMDWDENWDTVSGYTIRRLYDVSLGEDPLDPEDGTPAGEAPWTMRRVVP
jgi:hypothetical protein